MRAFTKWDFLFLLSFLISIGFIIGIGIWLYVSQHQDRHTVAYFAAACFVLITVPTSIFQIVEHLRYFTQPQLQRYIIRILWIVPIYSVNAFLALIFPNQAPYINAVREFYEAYVIYCFVKYLAAFLGEEQKIIEILGPRQVKLIPPLCCLAPWQGKSYLRRCHFGVLQYVVIRISTTIINVICQATNTFNSGSFSPKYAYLYVTILNNASQAWAMFCLVMFYQGLKVELAPMSPLGKFGSVKMIVFFSFWQSVFIAALVYKGVIVATATFTVDEISDGIQNFAVCVEMLIACIVHRFVFPVECKDIKGQELPQAIVDAIVPTDVIEEMRRVGNSVRKKLQPTNGGTTPLDPNEGQEMQI